MIDIHAHVLPLIDDGSASLEQSLKILKTAVEQGVTDVIATPHLRGEYNASPEKIKDELNAFYHKVKESGINVNLYPGQEIFIDGDYKKLFSSNSVLGLNQTKYVLLEFDYFEDFDIAEVVYELKTMGYVPVIAHFERYSYAGIEVAEEVKALGGLIQVNAESLVGKDKRSYLKKVKKLFNEGLVDFVASDVHDFRENMLLKAFNFVSKKFGKATAQAVFNENAKMIIGG